MERLRRWLARFKKYPPDARKLKQEGTVVVAFVIARDGVLLDAQIERSSGFPLIDEAALAMLRDASPVPPVPPGYPGDRLSIAMPVRYSIGFFGRLF
jgi:protein TonB